MKLLICDDDHEVLEMLFESFKDIHDCKTANDGRKGSELISLEEFDLVITDIDMPCGGGERILNELSPRSARVYVYSGSVTEEKREKYKKLGASDVFSKPEEYNLLYAVLTMSPHLRSKLAY